MPAGANIGSALAEKRRKRKEMAQAPGKNKKMEVGPTGQSTEDSGSGIFRRLQRKVDSGEMTQEQAQARSDARRSGSLPGQQNQEDNGMASATKPLPADRDPNTGGVRQGGSRPVDGIDTSALAARVGGLANSKPWQNPPPGPPAPPTFIPKPGFGDAGLIPPGANELPAFTNVNGGGLAAPGTGFKSVIDPGIAQQGMVNNMEPNLMAILASLRGGQGMGQGFVPGASQLARNGLPFTPPQRTTPPGFGFQGGLGLTGMQGTNPGDQFNRWGRGGMTI